MAKNIFKKHLTCFIKNKKGKVVINRVSDLYYICDGFTMLRVPVDVYNSCIRTESPIFCPLENEQHATREAREPLATVSPYKSTAMADIFNRTQATQPAALLHWVYDDPAHYKHPLRAVQVAGKVISFDSRYTDAISEYAALDALGASADRHPVIKWADTDSGLGCLVMPVNSDHFRSALADLVEVVKP